MIMKEAKISWLELQIENLGKEKVTFEGVTEYLKLLEELKNAKRI